MADSKPPCVPLVEQLDKIYQDVNGSLKEVHEKRFYNLMKRFEAMYGEKPKFFCRAPGRVNIIGEHIDYCGYSVLPAALDQDFIMAYIPSGDDKITINNVDKDLYPTETLTTEPHQKFREQAHFINYFLCGYKAVLALSDSPFKETVKEPKGFKMLCESLVPPAAGLSSSSAFCVCAAVTTLHANGLLDKIDQATLAELVIQAERMAGTACGGMDQTISLMGKMNTAKLIDFVPTLKATDVEIPPSVSLVIANSLTPSPKLATLGTRYNKRVVECRFGVAIMALKKGLCKDYMDCKYTTFQ
jgi:N-acetylgalactosamine kinase